jgi:hypothetical protein
MSDDVRRVIVETHETPWLLGGDSYMAVKPTLAKTRNVKALMPWEEYERLRTEVERLKKLLSLFEFRAAITYETTAYHYWGPDPKLLGVEVTE